MKVVAAGGERGQATVELALVVPVVVVLALVVAQAAVLARTRVLVAHAAREAARAAAVDPAGGSARAAAMGAADLESGRLGLALAGGRAEGDTLRVTVTYRAPTSVPIVGALVGDVTITEQVAVRVE